MRSMRTCLALAASLFLFPGFAAAQTSAGSIAGTVRDTSGAVLPGVTVEAASPALIEKVKSAVTDGTGQYRIVDLRPGLYSVTMTLPGFSTVQRTGIELTGSFTATVNADLRVGSIEETLTVTGAAPIVDIQNTQRQTVMNREILDTLPTARNYTSVGVMIPGIVLNSSRNPGNSGQEVGGTGGVSATFNTGLTIHGSRLNDQQMQIDGMPIVTLGTVIQAPVMMYADINYQEMSLDTGANAAEIESGGVRVNLIPREGGNTFKGETFATFSHPGLQADNMSAALRQQGLNDANKLKTLWQYSGALGGPIKRDKVWFFAAHTRQLNENYIAGQYVNTNAAAWNYVPDLNNQAFEIARGHDFAVRGTWQATPRNKVTGFYDFNNVCFCTLSIGTLGRGGATGITTLEASDVYVRDTNIVQVAWSSPATNRLLFEAGYTRSDFYTDTAPQPNVVAVRIVDTGLGLAYRNQGLNSDKIASPIADTVRGSIAYVTGTHSVKLGVRALSGGDDQLTGLDRLKTSHSMEIRALNGVPNQVTYYAYPGVRIEQVKPNIGVYAQDQWTKARLTMNLGVRYDYFRASYPDHSVAATEWVPVARFAPGRVAVSWHDLSPRLGVAYDLFGNAKTALKVSANRYVIAQSSAPANDINPIQSNLSNNRSWADANGDHIVQGDALNPAANGELGRSTNLSFGQNASSLEYDPGWAFGFGQRPYNWEFSAGVQHELLPRISVGAAFFRRVYGNFDATVNQVLAPADFDPYCVTTPADSRLPGGGGQQICGLYDLKANKVGLVQSIRTNASDYGDVIEHWNGVDLTMQARLNKVLLQGGVSSGRTTMDNCAIATTHPEVVAAGSGPSNPSAFCHVQTSFGSQTQVKLSGSYTMPWDVGVAATFQHLPGPQDLASASYTNAQVAPSLGRPLASATTLNLPIVQPGTVFGDRLNQFDLRLSKLFRIQRAQLRGALDIYNLFNGGVVTTRSATYGATTGSAIGSAWLRPLNILQARLIKFNVQLAF